MQSVSSKIWTRVAICISYDDNHYSTDTFSSALRLSVNLSSTELIPETLELEVADAWKTGKWEKSV